MQPNTLYFAGIQDCFMPDIDCDNYVFFMSDTGFYQMNGKNIERIDHKWIPNA